MKERTAQVKKRRIASEGLSALALSVFFVLSSTAQVKTAAPSDLTIQAVLREPSVCAGTRALPAQLIIINRSTNPLIIDIARLKTNFTFFALVDTDHMQRRHAFKAVDYDLLGSERPRSDLQLQPNEAYVKDIQIPTEGPFFTTEGFYSAEFRSSLSASRGSRTDLISSTNTVLLEVKSCETEERSKNGGGQQRQHLVAEH